jgi:hypothetical protein
MTARPECVALADVNRTDTFFAPTNAGIASLLSWGGFQDKVKVGLTVSGSSNLLFQGHPIHDAPVFAASTTTT